MSDRPFLLKPFQRRNAAYEFNISGNISRHDDQIALEYKLIGKLLKSKIPEKAVIPKRKDYLWQGTCFEFFVAQRDLPQYWEINLSPSGDWNVYHFQDYRLGMHEESIFDALPFQVYRNHADAFHLNLEFDLQKIISNPHPIEIAVSAVIKHNNDTFSYWALDHRGEKPDFHHRDSFLIQM